MSGAFGPAIEWGVRPFARADALLQHFVEQRPAENLDAVANIRWGKQSTWGFLEGGGWGTITTIVIYPTFPGEGDDVPIEWLDQIAVDTEDVRIENPDDSEQYVIDQRMTPFVMAEPRHRQVSTALDLTAWDDSLPTVDSLKKSGWSEAARRE
jgi:hypothetical protein